MTDQTPLEPSDEALVLCAKAGELGAFETLVSRHEQRVYTLALRMLRNREDAEDVTQQTFLSALEHLGGFRGEAGFATWLLSIATHGALKVLRKNRGLETVSLDAPNLGADGEETLPHPQYIADWRQSPDQWVERNETRRLIDDALAQLDDKHRLVFLLRDAEGLSVRDTAAALNLSEGNVKVRLLRARLQLRELLTRAFGDPATRIQPPHHRHD